MRQLDYTDILQELLVPPVDRSLPSSLPPTQTALFDFTSDEPTEDIAEFLQQSGQLLWQTTLPAEVAQLTAIPTDLPDNLANALQQQGITQLYSHQLKALKAIRAGKDVVLTPPTASGKTLSAYIGILEGIMQQEHRCLSFYGLKALAADQSSKLRGLIDAMPLADRPFFAQITGDTTKEDRQEQLEAHPHLLAVTPDLMHWELRNVWKSEAWQHFLSHLKYVLIDEMHTFSGVYGANMALLLRRLQLAIDRYGGDSSQVQFIFLSATCGNPTQLARHLSGRKRTQQDPKQLLLIRRSGAVQSEKRILVMQPSYQANEETAKLMLYLMRQGKSGITFCNARETTKTLLQLVMQECQLQGCPDVSSRVAIFYGSLNETRRREIIAQLESGALRWIIATEALEAGIDLPMLDCAIIRGFPASRMSFQQRIGRAGRKSAGLAIYIPTAHNPIDVYYAQEERLLGCVESVDFNESYPLLLTKHLRCAAAESNIPSDAVVSYFGKEAQAITQLLLRKGHLQRGRHGLYTRSYPHQDVNFRGGTLQNSIKLVDGNSEAELEEMSESFAYREVYPGAIFRRQDSQGNLLTYQCQILDTKTHQAILQPIDATSLHTIATSTDDFHLQRLLKEPVIVPLAVEQPEILNEDEPAQLSIELGWGEVSEQIQGYTLMDRTYAQTCLNRKCSRYHQAIAAPKCPACDRQTRPSEIKTAIKEVTFEQPYQTCYSTPLLKVSLNQATKTYIQQSAYALNRSLTTKTKGYESLWEYPSVMTALHTLGHQMMLALPLVVRADRREINFVLQAEATGYSAIFFDTADGGNGASENLLKHWSQIAQVAADIARQQSSSDYLFQYGCPDHNEALVNDLGLLVLDAIVGKQPDS